MTLKIKAYAKINLTIDVLGTRDDGYHNIESVMHSIDLCDILFLERGCPDISVTCSSSGVPEGRENLAFKAAERWFKAIGIDPEDEGVRIHIQKNIPIAAGLAGGSTDAAGVLHGLNRLYDINMSTDKLIEIGLDIGSDVPFCIKGGAALVTGRGETLKPIETTGGIHLVLVNPQFGVSTRDAYNALDNGLIKERPDSDGMCSAVRLGNPQKIADLVANVFEYVIIPIYPRIGQIKDKLVSAGALGVVMSGSGPTVIGIAKDFNHAQDIKDRLEDEQVVLATTIG